MLLASVSLPFVLHSVRLRAIARRRLALGTSIVRICGGAIKNARPQSCRDGRSVVAKDTTGRDPRYHPAFPGVAAGALIGARVHTPAPLTMGEFVAAYLPPPMATGRIDLRRYAAVCELKSFGARLRRDIPQGILGVRFHHAADGRKAAAASDSLCRIAPRTRLRLSL